MNSSDLASIASLATAGGTLVLAVATFAAVRSANRAARAAEQSLLVGLRPLRGVLRRHAIGREEFVVQGHASVDVEQLVGAVRVEGARLLEMRIAEEADERTIHLHVAIPAGVRPDDLAARLADVHHVRNVDWSA